jgi:hypothetical protein
LEHTYTLELSFNPEIKTDFNLENEFTFDSESLCHKENSINQFDSLFNSFTMLTSEQQQQQQQQQLQTTTTANKSPEILFSRGLSVLLDPFPSSLDTVKVDLTPPANTTNLDSNLNSEKTYDLSDYLYQNNQKTATTLTQLEPVRPATPPMIDTHKIAHNLIAMNECSMDSSSSTSSKEQTSRPNKRGRKPASSVQGGAGTRSKFGKYVDDNTTKTLVYFGNKRVEIGTDEYDKRRKNNNEAVKKCRQKMEQEQKEREAKMTTLMDENRRLNEKVNTMSKEMEVLKGIIISMKPDNTLPEFIQKPMNDL